MTPTFPIRPVRPYRGKIFAALLCGLLAASAGARSASATICFPPGFGVPGASGVPKWWGGDSSNGINDPRWRGAAMFNHVGDQARYQVVVDNSGANKYLVMMWTVNADPTADDLLYFGFYVDGGTPGSSDGNVFRIKRKFNAAIQDGGTPDGGAGSNATTTELAAWYWNKAAATPKWENTTGLPAFPTWISDDTRLDVVCGSSACDTWDIRLRVKVVGAGQGNFANPNAAAGAGIELPSSFKFWYEIKTVLGGGGTPDLASPVSSLEFNPAVITADPDLTDPANFADEAALGGPRFPATGNWMQASVDTTLSTCEKGINIQGGDIGVVNSITGPAGGSTLSLLGANELHAKPHNNTGGNVAGGGILARFRIADWNTASHSSAIWRDVPGCTTATGSGTVANTAAFDLTCPSWTLSPTERCEYNVPSGRPDGCPPATKDDHQCVLVDLKTASGQFYFSSVSAYRNMDFVGASEFKRKVRVDVNGLPAFAGPDPNRDVYVYLQTRNMPAQISSDPKGEAGRGGGDVVGASPALLKRLEIPAAGRIGSAASARIQKAYAAGQLTWNEISQLMPTHVAYAWHDTGKTVSIGGTARKLLRPQSSFGYFVSHDGELHGWENKLQGATVTQIGPNFYKVAVPQNGSVNAETVINALDKPLHPPPPPPWWLLFLILLLIVIGFVLWLRRRSMPPPPAPPPPGP